MKTVLCLMLLVTTGVFAEDVQAPKLKDEIALSIRSLQVQVLVLQEDDKVKQYLSATNQLKAKYDSALKDSAIDPLKYQLDPLTLTVVPVPAKEIK